MKTLFNRKSWLLTLSVAFFASSMSTSVVAQLDQTIIKADKVTIIQTTSNENLDFFTTVSEPQNNKDHSSYTYKWATDGTLTKGKKPKLGILLEDTKTGTIISKTFPNSTAIEAGLQKGDKIIALNGKKTENISNLIALINEHKIGDKVTIKYVRDGALKTGVATFKGETAPNSYNRKTTYYTYNYNHHSQENLTEKPCEKLAKLYGKPFLGVYLSNSHRENGTGAVLTSIIEGTGAEDAVLMAADKIVQMNNKAIASTKEAIAFISSKKPGDKISIQLIRDSKSMTIDATLGSFADNPSTTQMINTLEDNCAKETPVEVVEEEEVPATKKEITKKPTKEAVTTTPFEELSSMQVFPNPTTDFVNIQFEGVKAPLTINVISLDGKEMYTKTIQNFDGNYNDQLDFTTYPAGVYLINLKQNDQQRTQQVVVE